MPTPKPDASFSVLTGNNIDTHPFKAGSVIFREGDEARELFVVKSGQVRIQIGNRTITELGPDSIFGEMALIDNEPRSATATAATDVELVAVSEKQFLFLVSQTPYFALRVMRVIAQRLRATNNLRLKGVAAVAPHRSPRKQAVTIPSCREPRQKYRQEVR